MKINPKLRMVGEAASERLVGIITEGRKSINLGKVDKVKPTNILFAKERPRARLPSPFNPLPEPQRRLRSPAGLSLVSFL